MRMEIKVVPNAGINEVSEKDGVLTVRVKAPAKENRANIAVLKLLRKHFGKDVRIVSGLTGKRKIVEVSE
ncbi:MAG: DUF167 domain-containing protein [Candidatus Aenigmarchaeota archaeon]|nr:DUF167 domain-containing protein [Candidatus Aenigmarchaeota archaeon]